MLIQEPEAKTKSLLDHLLKHSEPKHQTMQFFLLYS